jgi:hypothetical protein
MRRGKQLVFLTPGKNVKRYVAGAAMTRPGCDPSRSQCEPTRLCSNKHLRAPPGVLHGPR